MATTCWSEWIGTLTRTTNLFDNNATKEFRDTSGLGCLLLVFGLWKHAQTTTVASIT